jgi:hypothetical protein
MTRCRAKLGSQIMTRPSYLENHVLVAAHTHTRAYVLWMDPAI